MLKRILSIMLFVVVVSQASMAQYNMPRGRVEKFLLGLSIGGKVGPNAYFGDIVDNGRARVSFDIFAERDMNKWLALRLDGSGGIAHGEQTSGNLEFKTGFGEIGFHAKFHPLNLIYYKDYLVEPYFSVGVSGIIFNAKKNPIGATEAEIEAHTGVGPKDESTYEQHKNWQYYDSGGMEFTGGATGMIGARYNLTAKLKLLLEVTGKYMLTDLLDGHDGYLMGKGEDAVWKESKGNDCLWSAMVGVQYHFYTFTDFSATKYSRRQYMRNSSYGERNAGRMRRR